MSEEKCTWWGCGNPADGSFCDGSDDMKEIKVCGIHRDKLWPDYRKLACGSPASAAAGTSDGPGRPSLPAVETPGARGGDCSFRNPQSEIRNSHE